MPGWHDLFADLICCWVYSRLPDMKARWSIAGALFLALVLAPSASRASARPKSAPSCDVARPRVHSTKAGKRTGANLVQLAASGPSHHAPAPRLHRTRGKKISVQGSTILALQCFAATRFLVPDTLSGRLMMDGPNPSRGPPLQFSL